MPNFSELLQPVEMLAVTTCYQYSQVSTAFQKLKGLFTLPARLGGLGFSNAVLEADLAHQASLKFSSPLCALEAVQKTGLGNVTEEQKNEDHPPKRQAGERCHSAS